MSIPTQHPTPPPAQPHQPVSPPLPPPRIAKRQPPTALTLRRRQPQPHQMPPRRRGRMVRVLRARVQDVLVGEELDVADFEDHVQGEALAGRFKHVGGFELGGGEGGDEARGGEAG